jgi:hypothetical protein
LLVVIDWWLPSRIVTSVPGSPAWRLLAEDDELYVFADRSNAMSGVFDRTRCGGITYKFCARVEMKWSVLIDGGCGDGWHGER